MGSKVIKINKNENFAVYNCHTQIVRNLRLVANIIHYKAKNIIKEDMLFFCCKNRNLDSYRFTLEYVHIRKIRGFSFKTITDVTQFN